MPFVPRLAIGALDQVTDAGPIVAALLSAFRRAELQPQCFLASAQFRGFRELAVHSGTRPHHLDRWLMSFDECRRALVHGSHGADVAVVVGGASLAAEREQRAAGGDLLRLCRELSLPLFVAVDCAGRSSFPRPSLPRETEGVFLFGIESRQPATRVVTELEALWGVPVIGAVGDGKRGKSGEISSTPCGLGGHRAGRWLYFNAPRFWRSILSAAEFEPLFPDTRFQSVSGRTTIAIACDEAFYCYYPQTLDAFTRAGARIVDFSPLRSESLPPGTDVLYFGCGGIEDHLPRLAANHCLRAAVRRHAREGKRIYAEGAGAAWLSEVIQLDDGRQAYGAGVIPAVAHRCAKPDDPQAVTLTVQRPSWLAQPGEVIRGYRNPKWWFEPFDVSAGLIAENAFQYEWLGGANVVGSTIHCDFAVHPHLFERFFSVGRLTRPRAAATLPLSANTPRFAGE